MLLMTKSKIGADGNRYQETVEMTAQEEADFLAQQAADNAEQAVQDLQRKRKKLIDLERARVIDALIAPEMVTIDNMNEAALDAALLAGGIV